MEVIYFENYQVHKSITSGADCWKAFKTAAIVLGIVSLTALLNYEKMMERLVVQWPAVGASYRPGQDRASGLGCT